MTSKEAIETAKAMKKSIEHNVVVEPDYQSVLLENGIGLSINSYYDEPKSFIKIGELHIPVNKRFTPEQKEHIKDYFGFEVIDIEEE